jgi:hypothetical protein
MELCEQAVALGYCAFWIRVWAADYGEVEEIHCARHDFGATSYFGTPFNPSLTTIPRQSR